MNGIALTVLLSQVPKLCGFSVNAEGPLRQVWGIVQKVQAGNTNLKTHVRRDSRNRDSIGRTDRKLCYESIAVTPAVRRLKGAGVTGKSIVSVCPVK